MVPEYCGMLFLKIELEKSFLHIVKCRSRLLFNEYRFWSSKKCKAIVKQVQGVGNVENSPNKKHIVQLVNYCTYIANEMFMINE